jgi:hypothetical protein
MNEVTHILNAIERGDQAAQWTLPDVPSKDDLRR